MNTIATNTKMNSAVEVCNCSSYCIFSYFSCSFIDQSLQSCKVLSVFWRLINLSIAPQNQ